jgi:hypothetical protein
MGEPGGLERSIAVYPLTLAWVKDEEFTPGVSVEDKLDEGAAGKAWAAW